MTSSAAARGWCLAFVATRLLSPSRIVRVRRLTLRPRGFHPRRSPRRRRSGGPARRDREAPVPLPDAAGVEANMTHGAEPKNPLPCIQGRGQGEGSSLLGCGEDQEPSPCPLPANTQGERSRTIPATLTLAAAAATTWDIAIIGAGPAGSSAARGLASAGLTTLLIDKSHFPRWKVCGCCLNAAALASPRRPGRRRFAPATRRATAASTPPRVRPPRQPRCRWTEGVALLARGVGHRPDPSLPSPPARPSSPARTHGWQASTKPAARSSCGRTPRKPPFTPASSSPPTASAGTSSTTSPTSP